MKIIIAGVGEIGKQVIKSLSSENHEIMVIDIKAEKIEKMINSYNINGIVGDASDKEILIEAGIKESDVFISSTNVDETNILNCLIAKTLGAKYTVARIRQPHLTKDSHLLQQLGISLLINPEKEVADEILNVIRTPEAMEINVFDKNTYLLSTIVRDKSKLVNKTLYEIAKEYKADILFGAIVRDNEVFIPNGNSKIRAGDLVYLVGTRDSINEFFDKLKIPNKRIKNILIVEGARISKFLLSELNGKYRVKYICSNKNECAQFADNFSKVECINNDGTDQSILKEQGIEDVDCFISLNKIDEENLIAGLFAKQLNVSKIVINVDRPNLANMINSINFATIVSPVDIIAERITGYVRSIDNAHSSKVEKLFKLLDGKIEAIEFIVGNDCKFINKQLKQIKLVKDTLIGVVIRDEEAIIPNGSTEILLNDKVIVISKKEIADINHILR